jgi:hypothetical protein
MSIDPERMTGSHFWLALDESGNPSAIRGDGNCSVWAILIGYLALLSNPVRINTLQEVLRYIMLEAKALKKELEGTHKEKDDLLGNGSSIPLWELQILDGLCENRDTIFGTTHIQILARYLRVQIRIWNHQDNNVSTFGYENDPIIRVSTNNAHYNLFLSEYQFGTLNKKIASTTGNLWNEQWKNHPHFKNPKPFLDYTQPFPEGF